MYIAIAGNIGSGKTSLTEILSKRYGARAYFEDSENPYIGDFYEDMPRWAFNLQMYFLGKRIREAKEMLSLISDGGSLVQDRTVYEDAHIFASNLHEMGVMASRDFDTYMSIFELIAPMIPRPDVLIYLEASTPTLITQIQKRGRPYEESIMEEYLDRLNRKYDHWIRTIYPGEVVTLPIDGRDFLAHPELLEPVFARLDKLVKSEELRVKS